MNPILIVAAAAALGIEVGWKPLPEGGHEYTIEIEPQMLEVLKSNDITSEVPPQLNVRRYRVTIGTAKLARNFGEPPAAGHATLATGNDQSTERQAAAAEPAALPPPGARTQPLKGATQAKQKASPASHQTDKPMLDAASPPNGLQLENPWLWLGTAGVLLVCSLGANLWLAMMARDARSRYRTHVANLRTAGA